MNKNILKQVSLLSIFLGAALGIITVIPYLGEIAFWILICLSSTCVILFMVKKEMLTLNTVQESSTLGAIAGFISFIAFSIFYIPIIIILAKVFQTYPNYGISVTLSSANFGLIIMFVVFVGVLSATLNAFSGFLTFYGIELYKMLNKKNDDEQFRLK